MDFDEVKRSFDRDCRIGVEPLLVSATVEIFDNRQSRVARWQLLRRLRPATPPPMTIATLAVIRIVILPNKLVRSTVVQVDSKAGTAYGAMPTEFEI